MRSLLKQFAIIAALVLLSVATFAAGRGEPWVSIGIGFFLLAIIWSIFTLRDAIGLALRRSGQQTDKGKVLTHVVAVLAFLMALAVGFGTDDPRMHGVRWFVLMALPGGVYVIAYSFDRITSLYRSGRRSPPADRPTKTPR